MSPRVLICVVVLVAGVARAQPATAGLSSAELEQRSKAHYRLGLGHLELREDDAAIKEFETGYGYKPLPLFLYNIGQVASLAGRRVMALEYYEKYLAASPRAPERAEVQKRIAELQRSLAAEPESTTPPPAAVPVDTTNGGNAAPAPAAASAPPASAPAPAVTAAATPTPRARAKEQSRKKVGIALGVIGGELVIGGVLAIGLTQTAHNDNGFNDWGTLVVKGR